MSVISKCKENLHSKYVVVWFCLFSFFNILQHWNADNNKKLNFINALLKVNVLVLQNSASSSEQRVYFSNGRTGRKKEEECAAVPPFLCDWNSWVCTSQCVFPGDLVSGGTSTNDLPPLACHRACSQLCFLWETWMWAVEMILKVTALSILRNS